jgi:lysophospholipase L1-like esterase
VNQAATYLSGVKGDISGTLFVIEIGANDIFFDLNVTAKEPLRNVEHIIHELEQHGETRHQHHY